MNKITHSLLVLLILALGLINTGHATERITYFHEDASGSPIAATDEAGNLLWRESYQPYGDRLKKQDGNTNKIWFHGKQQDADTGLSYFGARYYDPVVGRFMGVDPQEYEESNPHSFNRYAYGNNNPYKFVDPDGRNAALVAEGIFDVTFAVATRFGAATAGAWIADKVWNATHNEEHNDKEGDAGANKPAGKSPEISPKDLDGKSKGDIEKLAGEKGLVQDPKKPSKWRDPETGKERLRVDDGHVDRETGKPYDNPNAAQPHAHGYDQAGKPIRSPETGDKHFPLKGE